MSRAQLLIINGAVLTGCAVFDYAWRSNLLIGLMLFLPLLDKTWSLPNLSFNKTKLFTRGTTAATGLLLIALNPDYATTAASTLVFAALPEEWFFRAYFMKQLSTSVGVKFNVWFPRRRDRESIRNIHCLSRKGAKIKRHEYEKQQFLLGVLCALARGINGFFHSLRSVGTRHTHFLSQPVHIANILSSALFALLHTPTQGWFGLTIFFPSLFYGWVYQRSGDIVLVIFLHTLSNIIFVIYLAEYMK